MRKVLVILCIILTCTAWADSLEPWGSNTDPTDVPRKHVEEISSSRHEYTITQRGTMDGYNCRSPIGGSPWIQTWESNRSVRLENTGETDVINPWLSNGRNNFRTIDEIIASACEPGMTDRDKAVAIYTLQRRHRFHSTTGDNEVNNPVKVFNVYGFTLCGNDATCLAGLWRSAGMAARSARPTSQSHSVAEVFYDDDWHLIDGDENCIYLLRDNHTIAGEQDIARDHDLVKRTHTYGILAADNRMIDEFSASLYVREDGGGGSRDCVRGHSMNMTLRPGEAITWRWGHTTPSKFHKRSVDKVCNGLWEYHPDFTKDIWQRGAESIAAIVAAGGELRAEQNQTGTIIWKLRSPYVFVGGRLEIEGEAAKFALSWDGEEWQEADANLDAFFPPAGEARYEYFLKCELTGDARLKSLGIINDIQMAPLALPEMRVGENRFVYTDESPGGRQVRITHEWIERSSTQPPAAPTAPIFPRDGADVEGSQFTFQWYSAEDPDGDNISDYNFELSDRPDLKWPLSPNFEKLISNTADAGQTQYTIPYVGLLTPDTEYYWRVRAKDENGVWGPWSETWRFTPRGPAVPLNVRIEQDAETGAWVLRWDPNPVGRRPILYRVYGSDEKGFTANDIPYQVNAGKDDYDKRGSDWKVETFPANFLAETGVTEVVVLGPQATLPNANRAYYRIVAVDTKGVRSGPSDYASAPRPFIYSEPVVTARVGQQYSYQVASTRSLGDLRMHGTYRVSTRHICFGDIEAPIFSIEQGPDWLAIDEATGLLSGTPQVAGTAEVSVAATIERLGKATQDFVIRIAE